MKPVSVWLLRAIFALPVAESFRTRSLGKYLLVKLLILSLYFTPDLSAGSFRVQALIDELTARRKNGVPIEVDLITAQPNRYNSLAIEAPEHEDHGWLRVRRISIPQHRGGMKDQARAYLTYARGVRALTRKGQWDIVFATSSRLMTAGLGAHVSRRLGVPLYLDIRDLFTDNMVELLAGSPLRILMPAFRWIERRAFRRASRINVVSEGFVPHVRSVAPSAQVSVLTNGIDDAFLTGSFEHGEGETGLPLIVYAGNMGEGQGLHRIVPQAASQLQGIAQFRLIGDGGQRQALADALAEASVTNVELVSPVPRVALMDHYRQADFLFMHLNDLQAFRRVLPSKVFEYGAIGKPILAGVAGHAASFCSQHLPDAVVFEPLDADALVHSVQRLIASPADINRAAFRQRFARATITRALAADILSLADR